MFLNDFFISFNSSLFEYSLFTSSSALNSSYPFSLKRHDTVVFPLAIFPVIATLIPTFWQCGQ